jgi:hypothetical protein
LSRLAQFNVAAAGSQIHGFEFSDGPRYMRPVPAGRY